MSEDPLTETTEADYTPTTQLSASSMVIIEETLERFIQTADVSAVYGQPIQNGETLIIPAAEVLCGMGFGLGAGNGPQVDDKPAAPRRRRWRRRRAHLQPSSRRNPGQSAGC